MKTSRVIITLVLMLAGGFVQADTPNFSVSAPQQVAVGQQFRMVFNVDAEAEGFVAPTFSEFNVLSGPNQSSSSNIQITNGQVSRSVTYSFTFILVATKEGTFTIPEARIRAGGKQLSTQPFSIKVLASASGSSTSPGQQQQQQQQQSAGFNEKDVFLRVSASEQNPYQGEEIIVTYKLYTRLPIASYNIDQSPAHPGFWSEELLKDRSQLVQYTESVNGEEYTVAEIRKVSLFPQRAGSLRIEPMKMDVVARVLAQQQRRRTGDPFFDNFFNDSFFSAGYQNVNRTLTSNAINIEVKPLPVNSKPAGFSGAVGDFSFQATVDRTELSANEGVNLNMVIKGKGNIRLVDKLEPGFPASFETFDPKITTDVQANASGVSGTRIIEQLAIPRSSGDFTIRPVSFVFFNPSRGQYFTHTSPEFNLKVKRGEGSDQSLAFDPTDQQAIQHVGSDIRYIRQLPFKLVPVGNYFWGSQFFWLLLVLPLIFFILFVILLRQNIRRNSDLSKVRNRKATRVARKRLKKAHEYLKARMTDKFYNELSQAIWGYLSDKFNIPLSELSLETVRQRLEKQQLNDQIISEFTATLNNCEFARFAPGQKEDAMERLYHEALERITLSEKELK
ncbi:MAG: BatD family protein [Bacteroidales bacterium]|nr:BatD family protein [Bacteroidales bacterium]MDZ4203688.1 BatD family protein [Bacteroidales bacterium]